MTDKKKKYLDPILDEIEKELRSEQWLKLWHEFKKPLLITVAVVILIFTGGISYRNYRIATLESLGDSYSEILDAIDEGGQDRALGQLQNLQNDSEGSYDDLIRLQEAAVRSRMGEHQRAVELYEFVQFYGKSPTLRDLATILWVYVQLDQEDPTQLRNRLTRFSSPDNVWHPHAVELEAFILLKENKKEEATRLFKDIALAADYPSGMRTRAQDMLSWLGAPLSKESLEEATP